MTPLSVTINTDILKTGSQWELESKSTIMISVQLLERSSVISFKRTFQHQKINRLNQVDYWMPIGKNSIVILVRYHSFICESITQMPLHSGNWYTGLFYQVA